MWRYLNKYILLALAGALLAAAPADAARGRPWLKWTLLGLDLGLTGAAVWAIMDQRSAADEYNLLYDQIDNTTTDNLEKLQEKEELVERKSVVALGLSVTAGAFIAYTVADKLWIHEAFPSRGRLEYDMDKRMFAFAISHEW